MVCGEEVMYDNPSLRPFPSIIVVQGIKQANPEWVGDSRYATTFGGAHTPCRRIRIETFSGRVIHDIKYVGQRTEQSFVPLNTCSSNTGSPHLFRVLETEKWTTRG